MADSSVLLEVIVEGKNIKLIQRQVEELGAAINNTSNQQEKSAKKEEEANKSRNKNARETYNNQRAVINGSLAQGRANAKLASGITGGLVPAYAEIVSNIFAVQQTFAALQRAADLSILKENLIETGLAAGQNLPVVAESLRDITDAALSTKDALQATANATAQGFSVTQLQELTRVAKGASAALGRDLTDSLDRLVRGTAKLEPEILDELGIIVRLDDATREYAAQLGKTAQELTQFERQQAFLNAAIEQGQKKFGDIAESTDVNPYNQLAASFSDLAQTLIEFANKAIIPVVEFFSQNKLALTAAILAFVQTIGNRLTPTIEALSTSAAGALETASDAAKELSGGIAEGITKNIDKVSASTTRLPKKFKDVKDSILDGSASTEKLDEGMKSLNRSISIYGNRVKAAGLEAKKSDIDQLKGLEEIKAAIIELTEQREALGNVEFDLAIFETERDQTEAFSDSLEKLGEAKDPISVLTATFDGLKGQFFAAKDGITKLIGTFDKGKISASLYNIVIGITNISLRSLRFSALLAGKALLNMIPFVGLIMVAFDLLKAALGPVIEFFKEGSKEAREVVDSFNEIDSVAVKLAKTLREVEDPNSFEAVNAKLKTRIGLLEQLEAGLQKISQPTEDERDNINTKTEKAIKAEIALRQRLQRFIDNGTSEEQARKILQYSFQYVEQLKQQAELAKKAAEPTKEDALLILTAFQARIEKSEELKDVLADQLPVLEAQREALLSANDPEVVQKSIKAIQALLFSQKKVLAAVEGLDQGFNNLRQEAVKLTSAQDTLASPFIKAIQGINNELQIIAENNAKLSEGTEKSLKLTANAFKETYSEAVKGGTTNIEIINLGLEALKKEEKAIRTAANERKKLSAEAKRLKDVAKANGDLTKAQITLENQATEAAIRGAEAKANILAFAAEQEVQRSQDALNNIRTELAEFKGSQEEKQQLIDKQVAAQRALGEAQTRQIEATANAESEILALKASLVDAAEAQFRIETANLNNRKEILDLDKKIFAEKQQEIKNAQAVLQLEQQIAAAKAGVQVNTQDRLAAARAENAALKSGEEERIRLQMEAIDIEYDLLRAKIAFERARLQGLKEEGTTTVSPGDPGAGPIMAPVERMNETAAAAAKGLAAISGMEDKIDAAETASRNLVTSSETHGQTIRNNNILLLEQQLIRDQIAASLEATNLQQARIKMLLSESVPFSESLVGLEQQKGQILQDLAELTKTEEDKAKNSLAISQKQNELRTVENGILQAGLEIAEKRATSELKFQQEAVSALKKRVDLEQEIASIERQIKSEMGIEESAANRFKREAEERQARIAVAEAEKNIKLAMINAEFGLLKAKQAQLKAELSVGGITPEEQAIIDANQAVLDQQSQLNAIVAGNIEKEFQLLKRKEKLEELKAISAAAEQASAQMGVGGGIAAAFEGIRQLFEPKEEKEKSEIDKELEKVLGGVTITEENKTEALIAAVSKTGTNTAEAIKKGMESVAQGVNNALATLTVNTLTAQTLIANAMQSGGVAASSAAEVAVQKPALETEVEAPTTTETAASTAATPSPTMETTTAVTDPGIAAMETAITPPPAPTMPEGGEEGASNTQKILLGAKTAASEFAEQMKQFGPEGEAMGAFVQGGVALGESLMSTMENFKNAETGAEKTKAVLGGIGSALGAIGQMQQAAAAGKVAAIDKEIAAERKRDGKSKESLAKIAAMEKKKEAIQRKAFEQNKKIQLAQAVVNGLSAIQSGFATQPFFPVGIAMGALAIAMTAMQIKAIQSQQYNGGASSAGGASAPTSISIGQRKTTSDLAKTQSVSGELAYMRGEDGIGGPEKFQPAFMGAKYRAMGGPTTGYVVGEQGPELFVPDTPGTIIPEGEGIKSSRPMDVTFNINTIDASGVEDLLVKQQGNIIGMVRSAANQYGEGFLEQVEVSSFTQEAGGVTKY